MKALLIASQLLIHDVPVECINSAAVAYQVPAKTIVSVLNTEGGKKGLEHKNTDGSIDYGSMQINSIWLPQLEKYGISKKELRDDPCTNVEVGTWILSQAIANGVMRDKPYLESVAGYNSKTPKYNQQYQKLVLKQYQHLEQVLEKA
jgi:soluble lytic murein transglycosylase-like protein